MDRGHWGQILDREIVTAGNRVVSLAIRTGKLPQEYIETDKRGRGDCRNYDIYDRLGGTWLVQRRDTTIDKYGAHPTKWYYLLRMQGGHGVAVESVERKSTACRAAKTATRLGDAIRTLRGLRKLPPTVPPPPRIVYKGVAVRPDGTMVSLYDGITEYRLRHELRDVAYTNHDGGLYCSVSVADAIDHAAGVSCHRSTATLPIVILRCRAAGKVVRYADKIAVSRLTPICRVGIG